MANSPDHSYPLLSALLRDRSLSLLPMYTVTRTAPIFGVCSRTIRKLIAAGKLIPRDLPGRNKFLPQDLEDYLRNSRKGGR